VVVFKCYDVIFLEKKAANYFEGTLQLRKCSDEIILFVEGLFEEYKVGIALKTKSKNGWDYKVSSNSFLSKLKNILQRKYNGRCIMSRKLFTRHKQTGKEVYRMTLLFEELPFKVGDMISDRGDEVKVIKIGEKIVVKNVKTGKNYFFNP
jgi:NMD protein affecting ribosome stability and mRNA decay